MTDIIKKRFLELANEAKAVEATKYAVAGTYGGTDEYVAIEAFLAWRVKAKSLVSRVCGAESEHYKEFIGAESYSSFSGNYANLKRTMAVFSAAQEDYEGGYLFSLRDLKIKGVRAL